MMSAVLLVWQLTYPKPGSNNGMPAKKIAGIVASLLAGWSSSVKRHKSHKFWCKHV